MRYFKGNLYLCPMLIVIPLPICHSREGGNPALLVGFPFPLDPRLRKGDIIGCILKNAFCGIGVTYPVGII